MSTTRSRLVPTRTRRLRSLVLVAAASTMLLSGCAGAHPGVAAQVGDTTITMQTIDDDAATFCTAVRPQLGTGQTPTAVSMGFIRTIVLQNALTQATAEQMAAEFGITPGPDYATALRSAELQASALPEEDRPTFAKLIAASTYQADITGQIAKQQLIDAGTAEPTQEQIGQAAAKVWADYVARTDITIDPRFGLAADLNAPQDGSVSYPVSKQAKSGDKSEGFDLAQDAQHAQTLPGSMRCSK